MFSLVNKHEEFFDFLVTNAEYFHKGTLMAREVLQDPSKLERYVKDVKALEHSADKVTHDISAKMRHVFTMKTLLYCKKGAKSPPKTKSSNFLTISRLRSKTLWPSPAPNLTV